MPRLPALKTRLNERSASGLNRVADGPNPGSMPVAACWREEDLYRMRMETLYRSIHRIFRDNATKNRRHFPELGPDPGARS